MSNNKKNTLLALLLTIAIAVSLFAIKGATAQTTKNSFPVIGAMPNPAGVGQDVLITTGITHATAWPHIGWRGLTVTVTKPDGTTQTLGPVTTDTTGLTGITFKPTVAGTYYLQTNFPEQRIEATAAGTTVGTIMKASTSEKYTLVVQQEPIKHYPGVPLPTGYWTRPIDAQAREWASISGNWLNVYGFNRLAPYNDDAPETAHVLWAKPYAEGGLVGGEFGGYSYEHGDAYEGKWVAPVIINGVLFYNEHAALSADTRVGTTVFSAEQVVVAVDLSTGKELWRRNWNNTRLAFGQIMFWDTFNMHGAFANLWTTRTVAGVTVWDAYDPFTGRWEYAITGVPAGTSILGSNGEIIRYVISLTGGWIAKWNTTRIVYETWYSVYRTRNTTLAEFDGAHYLAARWRPHGITFNATVGYEWNRTIPTGLPGSVQLVLNDKIIGSNTAWSGGAAQPRPVFWALSLKPGQEGLLLYNRTWTLPIVDSHVHISPSIWSGPDSLPDNIFVVTVKETRQHFGFDANTGTQLWGPTEPEPFLNAYSNIYMAPWGQAVVAYGKLFTAGMAGVVNAYDIKTGARLWTHSIADRYTEQLFSSNWPAVIGFITAGKIYLFHTEHSVVDPRPRGAPSVCLNAETGEVIWRMDGLRLGTRWGGQPIIADNKILGLDTYSNRIYALGKGPSAMTVEAPMAAITLGSSLVIRGTVTDVSPGTKSDELMLRFPNGVAAVADEFMSEWMLHVYKQFPMPTNARGVPVTIDVLDANGNYRNIGTAVSDASGFYSLQWTPDIEGKYTVIATFPGSKAYWPSYAETAFAVDPAPPQPAAPEPAPPSIADQYFLPAVAGIIIAIIVVGAVLALLMLKKRS